MVDSTIKQRMKRHRDKRKEQGWRKVTVWVTSDDEANEIIALAKKFRTSYHAESLMKKANVTCK